jgi:hypothetical protein
MVRPCVARGFVELSGCGLASMYPASDWSVCAPGHHGYQRACGLISGQASIGPFGSPVFACAGKTDPPSLRFLSQTSAGKRDASYVIAFSSSRIVPLFVPKPFLRPGLHIVDASREGAVKAGRRTDLTFRSAAARPCLDGAEHGASIKRVGRPHHQSSSSRSHDPWPAPPRRCGRVCWRAQLPARCDAAVFWRPRSRL